MPAGTCCLRQTSDHVTTIRGEHDRSDQTTGLKEKQLDPLEVEFLPDDFEVDRSNTRFWTPPALSSQVFPSGQPRFSALDSPPGVRNASDLDEPGSLAGALSIGAISMVTGVSCYDDEDEPGSDNNDHFEHDEVDDSEELGQKSCEGQFEHDRRTGGADKQKTPKKLHSEEESVQKVTVITNENSGSNDISAYRELISQTGHLKADQADEDWGDGEEETELQKRERVEEEMECEPGVKEKEEELKGSSDAIHKRLVRFNQIWLQYEMYLNCENFLT
ncbi:unnamed protein product [Protopolystoma xenopodis]|uniref:Uncharacterized protein n=1 Tax=Protopolystoma xenopodis TaxID=117903 RepID=A0A3S5CHK3_9PLAT|nr:unnamed protein product [Protopolystoma xenopodis]